MENVYHLRVSKFAFTMQHFSSFSIVLYQTLTIYMSQKSESMISTLFLLRLKETALIYIF